MADDVVPDRLAFIKSVFAENPGWVNVDELRWLIAEVERLREKNDRQVFYGQRALDVAEKIVALRGALQALVDATEEDWATIVRARARAVAVLTGQEPT